MNENKYFEVEHIQNLISFNVKKNIIQSFASFWDSHIFTGWWKAFVIGLGIMVTLHVSFA